MRIFKSFFLIIFFFIICEIIIGYFGFHYVNYKYSGNTFSSLLNVPKFLEAQKIEKEKNYFKSLSNKEFTKILNSDEKNSINIFIEDTPDNIGYKYHPLIEFTNVHGKYETKNDYFGFRNKKDYYFKKNDNIKIIFTGGSECAGYGHEKTISDFLSTLLREKYKTEKIDVINLCMNSYVISNEIQTFINLAWNLKPDIVISHTGWNDAFYSVFVPNKFIQNGMIYYIGQEQWKDILYDNKIKFKNVNDKMIKNFDADLFFKNTKINLEKYDKIVKAAEGKLIVGLQPFNRNHYKDKNKYQEISLINMKKLNENFNKLNMHKINFNHYIYSFKFIDNIHTETSSAKISAEIYSKYITLNFENIFKEKLN